MYIKTTLSVIYITKKFNPMQFECLTTSLHLRILPLCSTKLISHQIYTNPNKPSYHPPLSHILKKHFFFSLFLYPKFSIYHSTSTGINLSLSYFCIKQKHRIKPSQSRLAVKLTYSDVIRSITSLYCAKADVSPYSPLFTASIQTFINTF